MDIYYGKMNNENDCSNLICSGGIRADYSYFGGMQVGDLAFIRLQQDGAVVKRLWKLDSLYHEQGRAWAKFSNILGDESDVFFNDLSVDKFTKLNLFNVGIVCGNKAWKQSKKKGFFKLDLCDPTAFNNAIQSKDTFNAYIADQNHFRKIVFVGDDTTPHSDIDIQIHKNGNSFAIYNNDKPFLAEINQKFNSSCDRYPTYIRFLNDHPGIKQGGTRKKVKDWLEQGGNSSNITIADLWDFFCSQEPFRAGKKEKGKQQEEVVKEDDDDDEEEVADYKNLIIYGIPGCGKSYKLKNEYLKTFEEDLIIRTTFHPEYSNTDFVGQVRPIKKGKDIDYEVIPGPFTEALSLAYKYPDKKVALVIEEINRGNAAAIFGDLFQLLDRDQNGDSEYKIKNETITSYLIEYLRKKYEKIYIPSNLYLYATMNTSDQNVFKLDTAFKRRWEFERLTNEDTLPYVKDFVVFSIDDNEVRWKDFVEVINSIITDNDDISGDRQIGNFFYVGEDYQMKRFANKVLEYLYNDVCRYGGREDIFDTTKYKSFDEIYDAFVSGKNVFVDGLFVFDKPVVQAQPEAQPAEEQKQD